MTTPRDTAQIQVPEVCTRRDLPYCQYGQDGTVTVFVRDREPVMRLTFAAAEDLAENMASCAAAGRQSVKP